ncbi:MAG: phosphatase PAP2 family protein [Candidatus Anstonellaceae archaeon]
MLDLVHTFSLLLHELHNFAFIIAGLVALSLLFNERKRTIFAVIAIAVAILLGFGMKNLLAKDRPCIETTSFVACPSDYSLPSMHSLVAFTLAAAFLPSRLFLLYFAFAWLVAFSRIYLGVHTFTEVAAGLALSILPCMLTQHIYKAAFALPKGLTAFAPAEEARQIVHFAACAGIAAIVWIFGATFGAVLTCVFLALGMIISWLHTAGFRFADFFLALFDRPSLVPGYGAITLFAGALAAITLLPLNEEIVASIFILGAGDAASTLIGRKGQIKLPYNKSKTAEGTLSFLAACLPVAAFGTHSLLVAALAAVAESFQNGDDNLLISLVCVLGFTAF